MKLQPILVAYGLANAVLYSAMLPLWEGFDEPFHFGYVQHLANAQGLPDPRASFLSREIGSSILIAPRQAEQFGRIPGGHDIFGVLFVVLARACGDTGTLA